MKSTTSYLAITVSAVSLAASSATAGDFYLGATAGAMTYDYSEFGPAISEEKTTFGGLLGWRTPYQNFFYGIEGDFSIPLNVAVPNDSSCGSGFAVCQFHGDVRLRAIAGYSLNDFDLFAGVGGAYAMMRDNAGNDFSVSGISYNVGVNYHINNKMALRLEGVNDNYGDFATPHGKSASWNSTTIRAAAVYSF